MAAAVLLFAQHLSALAHLLAQKHRQCWGIGEVCNVRLEWPGTEKGDSTTATRHCYLAERDQHLSTAIDLPQRANLLGRVPGALGHGEAPHWVWGRVTPRSEPPLYTNKGQWTVTCKYAGAARRVVNMAKVWENRSMEAKWEINKDDTLNSLANKTFGHPPAHKVPILRIGTS